MNLWFKKIQEYSFNKNNVYIVPTRFGFRFVFINFFLFIIAITYSNNLALLVSFFMVTYFVIQMFATHRIIYDISLKHFMMDNQFSSSHLVNSHHFKEDLDQDSQQYIKMELFTDNGEILSQSSFEDRLSSNSISMKASELKRGKYLLSKIKYFTTGSNQLFYVWRYFKINQELYIYPSKKLAPEVQSQAESKKTSLLQERDFDRHVRYVSGMPSKRIDWKVYAKSDYLFSKLFTENITESQEINFLKLTGETEEKLQKMSYLIEKAHIENISFSLVLPSLKLPLASGPHHYRKSMEVISEF